jgi:hypothetical protein
MAEGEPVVRFIVAGVNAPPALSLGVIVTVPVTTALPAAVSATVKLVEATLTVPELGPYKVYKAVGRSGILSLISILRINFLLEFPDLLF